MKTSALVLVALLGVCIVAAKKHQWEDQQELEDQQEFEDEQELEVMQEPGRISARKDRKQDAFMEVTLMPPPGSPDTRIFKGCYAPTRKAKFYSIELSSSSKWRRYVPDTKMLAKNYKFQYREGTSSLIDCADKASGKSNVKMFKYLPGFAFFRASCEMSTSSFDLNTTPECATQEVDAVFIKY